MAKRKKKKATPEKAPKENFYVSLNDPTPVRRALLESVKQTLESAKVFSELKLIRKEKIAEKKNLRVSIKEINSTINKIKAAIPTVNIPTEHIPKFTKKKAKKKKVVRVVKSEPVKPHTELQRIEVELADIDKKLAGL